MDALTYPDRTPHTGLLEAKHVYRPVRVSKGSMPNKFIIKNLLAHVNAGMLFDGFYEITSDGKVISGEKFEFSVAPLGKTEITISKPLNGDYIRFIFTMKKDTDFCEKGYEVCFDQLALEMADKENRVNVFNDVKPDVVTIEEAPLSVTAKLGTTEYHYNKRKCVFDSIKFNGKEILEKPLEFNIFRAPVDNDVMRGDWYRAHLNDYITKGYETTVTQEENCVKITQKQSIGWSIHQPIAYMNVVYSLYENGIQIHADAEFGNKVTFLPRFGIRLFLSEKYEDIAYYGYGPYESYIDKHQASYVGNFTGKVSEMHEDYIMPQENSSHYGCRNMSVSDGETIISFTHPKSFSFNASVYSQEELAAKRHNYELTKSGYHIICVDYKMAGVGSNACGPQLDDKYRLELPKIEADFYMTFSKMK